MAFQPKILKRVTIPQLKMLMNREYYLRFDTPIVLGEVLEKSQIKTPPAIIQAFNYERWETYNILCNAVLVKELHKNYPNDSYVGKSFAVTMYNHSDPTKRYKLVSLSEIAEPTRDDFDPVDNTPANVDIETGEITHEEPVPESGDETESEPDDDVTNDGDPIVPEPEQVTKAKNKKKNRAYA